MFRIVDVKTHQACQLAKTWTGNMTGVRINVIDELKVLDTSDEVEDWVSYTVFCKILPSIIDELEPIAGKSKEELISWAKYVKRVLWRYENDNELLFMKTGGFLRGLIK